MAQPIGTTHHFYCPHCGNNTADRIGNCHYAYCNAEGYNMDEHPNLIQLTKSEYMLITRTSPVSGNVNSMKLDVTPEQLNRWQSGENIYKVFPHLSDAEREFIMTGITDEEWKNIFAEEIEERLEEAKNMWQIYHPVNGMNHMCDKKELYRFVAHVYAPSLGEVYQQAQNDFSEHYRGYKVRSTSVGDVIGKDGEYWMIKGMGFEKLDEVNLDDTIPTEQID
jgi:hypothetical protein